MKEIKGYRLKLTCGCCPEQYDVFKDGVNVGYFRLRNGWFTADLVTEEEITVYECGTDGDGMFTAEERLRCLTAAVDCLDVYLKVLEAKE